MHVHSKYRFSQPGRPETPSHPSVMLISMTTTRQANAHPEQLQLGLPRRVAAPHHPVPAQLRLDARTRQIGRAGIAEIRRIIAHADAKAA